MHSITYSQTVSREMEYAKMIQIVLPGMKTEMSEFNNILDGINGT